LLFVVIKSILKQLIVTDCYFDNLGLEMKDFLPLVSAVMPSYNEEKFIKRSIESLIDDYFIKDCELIIVDGMSSDGTREVVQSFIKKGLRVRLLENKKKIQAYGLNLGISNAKGDIIVRVDAHCLYPPGYINKCVELLETTGASNVGGMMLPQGASTNQKAISLALIHPLGVGDAKWHLGNFNGYVDTVYLGTFRKKLFDEIGLYDTNCKTNEDSELNLRILKAGKRIYLDSSIRVIYFPRESLQKLAMQYFKYGRGRCYTSIKHKKITSLRQLAPVMLIIGLSLFLILSFFWPLFLLFPLSYLLALFLTTLFSWPKKKIPLKQRLLVGLAWAIMHTCWGIGFLSYLIFHKKIR
jgi:succinoglycan biosynthesis protein ExoA